MRYPSHRSPEGSIQPTAFTVLVRGSSLSVRSPQLRWVVRGLKGTFLKFGVDPQENQLKAMKSPSEILTEPTYGVEDEALWGTIENIGPDDQTIVSK